MIIINLFFRIIVSCVHNICIIAASLDRILSLPGIQLSCWVTVTAKDILNTKDLFHPELVAGQSFSLGTSATSAISNQEHDLGEIK